MIRWLTTKWREDSVGKFLWAKSFYRDANADLSAVVFADDLKHCIPLHADMKGNKVLANRAPDFLNQRFKKTNIWFEEEINKEGYRQNIEKQKVLPKIVGTGSFKSMQRVLNTPLATGGTVELAIRHLGPIVQSNGSTLLERANRLEAARRGWCEMGGFWMADLPRDVKRMTLISKVLNNLLTGAESVMFSDKDWQIFNRTLVGYARAVLEGEAAGRLKLTDAAGDEVIGDKKWPNDKVLRALRLSDIGTEAKVRRIKWYQQIAREPGNHLQILTALFGRLRCEKNDTVTPEGWLTPTANSYAKRFVADIESAAEAFYDGERFKELWQSNVRDLFLDEDIKEQFLSTNFTQFRAAHISVAIPPPGAATAGDFTGSDEDEGEE